MEKIDRSTAEQVWQRVRGEHAQPLQEQTLMAMEAEVAAQLQLLVRHFPGKAQMLRPMLQSTRQHLACLQGLHLLRRGSKAPIPTVKLHNRDLLALLRKCYVNCLNLATKYEAAAGDTEYGIVFAEMAQTKRHHCTLLLSLLGNRK